MVEAYRDYFSKIEEFLKEAGTVSRLIGYESTIETTVDRGVLYQFEKGPYHGSLDALNRSINSHRRSAEYIWRCLENKSAQIGHPINNAAHAGFLKYGFMSVSDAPRKPKGKGNLDFRATIRSYLKSDDKKILAGTIEEPRFINELWADFAALLP